MELVKDLHTLKNLERVNFISLHADTGKMRSNVVGGTKVRCWYVHSFLLNKFVFGKIEFSIKFHQGCKHPFVYRMTEPQNVT